MSKKIWFVPLIFSLGCSSLYAASDMQNRVQQINTTADQIAQQSQTNMNTQRQQLQQYLQSIKPVAANPVGAMPAQAVQQAAPAYRQQQPVAQQPVRPQPTTVQQPNITGYQQNNGNNNSNSKQWNYNY